MSGGEMYEEAVRSLVGNCGKCRYCLDRADAAAGRKFPYRTTDSRMIVCPECGNKRCPRATNHKNDCTGSNEWGQPGSVYGGMPV